MTSDLMERPITSMMEGVLLYHDPVNVAFGLGIPPIDEWPGYKVTLAEVAAACGDGRDYFRYWHRALRHLETWEVFYAARERHNEQWYYDHWDWNQRLIMGIWGGGKTSIMVVDALGGNQDGIPCFHNGGPLFGWFLPGDEVFTAMGTIPPVSNLKTDEAHMVAARRLGAMTSVGVLKDLGANIRRKLCKWDLATGHYKDVHPQILEDCVEVLEAIKVQPSDTGRRPAGLEAWDDPNNFLVAWKHWGGSPFKNKPDWQREGLGDDYAYGWYDWVAVRNAYALNDSFGRNDWGTALLSDRDTVKGNLAALRGEVTTSGGALRMSPVENAVFDFGEVLSATLGTPEGLTDAKGGRIEWLSASQISNFLRDDSMGDAAGAFDARAVGTAIGKVMGVKRVRDKGYLVEDMARAWEREMNRKVERL